MRRPESRWRHVAALPLLAAILLVSGCQKAELELPPWLGGSKPVPQVQSPPPVPVPPQAAVPQPALPPPPPMVEAPPPAIAVEPLPAPAAPVPRSGVAGEVRAGLLLPLSGQYAVFGQTLSNAAQLALFEVADERFNLIPLDTKGTAEGAAAAAAQALAQGAHIILGPVFSPEVKAAAPLARDNAVPMMAFTTDRTAAGQGVYALGFLPGPQVQRVVSFARSQGKGRFAVLARNDDYGRAVADAAREAVAANGAQLVKVEFYDPAAADLTAPVKRFTDYDARVRALAREKAALANKTDEASVKALKRLDTLHTFGEPPFDAVLIPDEGVRLRSIASLMAYFDIDPGEVRLLGTLLWEDARLGAEAALVGGWYPAPPRAAHGEFEQRYGQAFGAIPARVGGLAGIAYDATALAAALARAGQGEYPVAALQNTNGFAGVDGIFRLSPDGTAERGLAVREITRTGSREVSPAPGTFAPLTQ